MILDELLSPLLTTTWGRRAGVGTIILMAILLCVTLFSMLFNWYTDMRILQTPTDVNVTFTTSHAEDQAINDIPTWHLFGKAGQSDILPITSLQLRLLGVIASTPAAASVVIISEASHPGKVYQVGDVLSSSGVRVYSITQDGVVLDNGGRLEKLLLDRPPLLFKGMPPSLLQK